MLQGACPDNALLHLRGAGAEYAQEADFRLAEAAGLAINPNLLVYGVCCHITRITTAGARLEKAHPLIVTRTGAFCTILIDCTRTRLAYNNATIHNDTSRAVEEAYQMPSRWFFYKDNFPGTLPFYVIHAGTEVLAGTPG